MPFPTTLDELRLAGYKFESHKICEGGPKCQVVIEMWITPRGKRIPLEVDNKSGHIMPHWTVCPYADKFRRPA